MALRITRREREELAKLTRAANRKRQRAIQKGVSGDMLPDAFSWNNIGSRDELNRYKSEAKRFTNKYNPNTQYIVTPNGTYTKRELQQLEWQQKQANRVQRRMRDRYSSQKYRVISEEMQGFSSADRTVRQDRFVEEPNRVFYSRDLSSFSSRAEYEKYMARLEKYATNKFISQRDSTFIENIQAGIKKVFGSDGDAAIRAIQEMNPEDVIKLYYTTDVLNVQFVYGEEAYQNKLEQLNAALSVN